MKKTFFFVSILLSAALGAAQAGVLVHGHRGARGLQPEQRARRGQQARRREVRRGRGRRHCVPRAVMVSVKPSANFLGALAPTGQSAENLAFTTSC